MCLRIDDFTDDPSYWYNPEYKEIEKELKSLPVDAFKVLYVHWGNEYINRPSFAQKKFAHWLIDAGFDLIIGMHPHVLQGYEEYNMVNISSIHLATSFLKWLGSLQNWSRSEV